MVMPRAKLSEELKSAIKSLNSKEKDKLLLRLIPKDQKLVHQLEFKLLENEATIEERRSDVKDFIISNNEQYPSKYYSPVYLLWSLKECSGKINYHKTITKDNIGEIELNLLMLIKGLGKNIEHLIAEDKWQVRKLAEYVINRMKKLHGLIGKLHEDYLIEFEDDIHTLKEIINKLPTFSIIASENEIEMKLIK